MDKRFTPLSQIEQIQKRQYVLEMIQQNPDWPINIVAKFIRTELHLTLSDMAKITKISLQTLQNLEKPDANPTLETMYKLLNAFGLKLLIVKK
ncbi:MAG: helix-turn-helix transcriptional regulator [Acinetobacter bohemicus]|jgi:DNA-binding XRE family transcriptional regulator|uniref:DNA-binding transcriptional regulator, XRE-family HTH domain n=1 Tax=Acinetobacter bohemicus TaxID=1435036 RepID=A0A1I6WAM7_9GAMM|nr:helix-turn-helix transcriptional regulator [Acinetobacter bohemicus]KAB0650324.1 helix-turn-helix transcriptional regulator [Acinetobacter bohemicus]SFT23045.1 DNA-binding transcriptional regulator, XRE-family HTH domain [Acinetobacter bohemicus]